MGERGPIGKRSSQRHGHRTAAEQARTVRVTASARHEVKAPAASRDWHPLARDMYNSLKSSGQAVFFEPSDWQTARLAAEVTSQMLRAERLSAMLLSAVDSMWSRLLMTESDRRRLRIELERPREDTDQLAAVAFMDEARRRLQGTGDGT